MKRIESFDDLKKKYNRDYQDFIRFVSEGDFSEAYEVFEREKHVASICSHFYRASYDLAVKGIEKNVGKKELTKFLVASVRGKLEIFENQTREHPNRRRELLKRFVTA